MLLKDIKQKLNKWKDTPCSKIKGLKITKAYKTMYDDLPSLYKDVNHQSLYGAYLSACVHYCTITGKSAVLNTFEFVGIDAEISLIIRQIADELVLGNK